VPAPAVPAQPDIELREPSHSSEDQVSGSDTVLGTQKAAVGLLGLLAKQDAHHSRRVGWTSA
jgi:hypothetical protein